MVSSDGASYIESGTDLGHRRHVVECFLPFRVRGTLQLGPQLGVGADGQHEVGAIGEGRCVEPKHLTKNAVSIAPTSRALKFS